MTFGTHGRVPDVLDPTDGRCDTKLPHQGRVAIPSVQMSQYVLVAWVPAAEAANNEREEDDGSKMGGELGAQGTVFVYFGNRIVSSRADGEPSKGMVTSIMMAEEGR